MINIIPLTPDNSDQVFRLAHISDPHLSTLEQVSWQQLMNKRILGYLSWRFNRRHIHRRDILTALLRDLSQTPAHHLLISGDFTHIGTPGECRQVSDWLVELGAAADITVVPGNHDTYVRADKTRTIDLWKAYMSSDATAPCTGNSVPFPILRERGRVAIIGLSTALPTLPFFASGGLGNRQIERLAQVLKQTGEKGLFRVVMLHHGPLAGSHKFRKRLVDAARFRAVILACGAELILHGHGHYPVHELLHTATAAIPVIGVPSASLLSSSPARRAGYNIYALEHMDRAWKIRVHSRRYDNDIAAFTTQEEREFLVPGSMQS